MSDLSALLEDIPANKQAAARNILSELEFIQETLDKLKAEIRENGVIEEFKQGKQDFTRESPALKSYNLTVSRFATLYKQLLAMVGKDASSAYEDKLGAFLAGD